MEKILGLLVVANLAADPKEAASVPSLAGVWERTNGLQMEGRAEADGTWSLVGRKTAPDDPAEAARGPGLSLVTGLRWDAVQGLWTGGKTSRPGQTQTIPTVVALPAPSTLVLKLQPGLFSIGETLRKVKP